MLITQIQVEKNFDKTSKLESYSSIVLDNQLAIHGIKILRFESGYDIAMPSRIKNKEQKIFSDIVHPINSEMRQILKNIILVAFDEWKENDYFRLSLSLRVDCYKTSIFEQDIADFEIAEEFCKKANETIEDDDSLIELEQQLEKTNTKIDEFNKVPIFNYDKDILFVQSQKRKPMFEKEVWKKIEQASISSQITDSDISLLHWVEKLDYVTSNNLFSLLKAGIIERSPNYIFSEKKVKDRISNSYYKSFGFLDAFIFTNPTKNQTYGTNIYTISVIGRKILHSLGISVQNNSSILKLHNITTIKKILAQNQWFCNMVSEYAENIEYYDIDTVMDTDTSINGRANINVYIKLKGQPIFAEAIRRGSNWDNEMNRNDYYDKVQRLSILANNYQNVTIRQRNAKMKKKPIIVIIAENENHCKELNNIFMEYDANFELIFTHDMLVAKDVKKAHFKFIDNETVPFVFL